MSGEPHPKMSLDPNIPICKQCSGKMWLTSLAPLKPGMDERTYRCTICSNVETMAVQYR